NLGVGETLQLARMFCEPLVVSLLCRLLVGDVLLRLRVAHRSPPASTPPDAPAEWSSPCRPPALPRVRRIARRHAAAGRGSFAGHAHSQRLRSKSATDDGSQRLGAHAAR